MSKRILKGFFTTLLAMMLAVGSSSPVMAIDLYWNGGAHASCGADPARLTVYENKGTVHTGGDDAVIFCVGAGYVYNIPDMRAVDMWYPNTCAPTTSSKFDNCISSVYVRPGWKVCIWTGYNFTGLTRVYTGISDMSATFNDTISSIKIMETSFAC